MRIIHSGAGWQRGGLALAIAAAAGVLLAFPAAAAGGATRGLALCGQVLIPTLFPFLVVGGYLIHSGVAAALGRRLERATRLLFGLPGGCATGILLAFLGGYPAGAAAVAGLRKREEITPEEGKRMMRFCVAAGPGFLVSAVGVGITGDARFGWILLMAQVISALILGLTGAPLNERRASPHRRMGTRMGTATAPFTTAVSSAGETMLSMCSFVILFSAGLSILDATGITAALPAGLATLPSCLLEVTGGCAAAAHSQVAVPFLLGFTVCFGGLSVHCQIAAILKDSGVFSASFFLWRLVHGVLGGLLTTLLFPYADIALPVFGGQQSPVGEWIYQSGGVSAALLVFCGVWMLALRPKTIDGTDKI